MPDVHAAYLIQTPAQGHQAIREFIAWSHGPVHLIVEDPPPDLPERCTVHDAGTILQRFDDHGLDEERFRQTVDAILGDDERPAIIATLVAILCRQDRPDDALLLERFWARLPRRFDMLCIYPHDAFPGQALAAMLGTHTHVDSAAAK